MTNCCAFDCSYCVNRKSNDVPRATFSPRELAELTVEFYRRNYIEGLFLSSAVLVDPDYTTERMLQVLRLLRGVPRVPARAVREAPLEVQATSYFALSARIVSFSIKDCSMGSLSFAGHHLALVSTTRPAMCRRLRSSPLMTISL